MDGTNGSSSSALFMVVSISERKEKSRKESRLKLDPLVCPRVVLIDQLSTALDLPSGSIVDPLVSGFKTLTSAWEGSDISAVAELTRDGVCIGCCHSKQNRKNDWAVKRFAKKNKKKFKFRKLLIIKHLRRRGAPCLATR